MANWDAFVPPLTGALASGLVAAGTAWAVFRGGRRALNTDREAERSARAVEQRKVLVVEVQRQMAGVAGLAMAAAGYDHVQASGVVFALTVSSLTIDLPPEEQTSFRKWADDFISYAAEIARTIAGMDDWSTSRMGAKSEVATQKLFAWYRGEISAEHLLLSDADWLDRAARLERARTVDIYGLGPAGG